MAQQLVANRLTAMNLQIWIDDSTDWGVLARYKWAIGLSDYDGKITVDYKATKLGDMQTVNEQGAIIFPRISADPRGGALTLSGLMIGAVTDLPLIMHTARYGRVTGNRLLFQATAQRASMTNTQNSGQTKGTVGGKAGVSYGIGSGEVSGSYERDGGTDSVATTGLGKLTGISLSWVSR